jgi:adenosylcobyric acid synthase
MLHRNVPYYLKSGNVLRLGRPHGRRVDDWVRGSHLQTDGRLAKCVAVLGTGSDVGKSVTAAALCRIFSNFGIRCAPFKAQNMSNNSFVTKEGGEIGRAQAVQAEAARAPMHVDMNPVLLKPCTDTGSQVVLLGKPLRTMEARAYFSDNRPLFEEAKAALLRLRRQYELVVIEGAGSCAEVNLRDRDFVNFETAHACDAPVILVADIDRGGVFAQVIGTLAVIPPKDRLRIKGIIINRFRGDLSLFKDGVSYLEEKTGLKVLGVIPHYYHIDIDSEDGMPLDTVLNPDEPIDPLRANIAVIRLPHISNFTDFNPLISEPGVSVQYLSKQRDLSEYDAVILPGTKNVRFDLEWLRRSGFDTAIFDHARKDKPLIGICGGYQMLGRAIDDPLGVEGAPGTVEGLGLLDISTTFHAKKILCRVRGKHVPTGLLVSGYEIHMGVSKRGPDAKPLLTISHRNENDAADTDGAFNPAHKIWGTYLHGIFDEPAFRRWFLSDLKPAMEWDDASRADQLISDRKDRQYELLAEHFARHLNIEELRRIAGI